MHRGEARIQKRDMWEEAAEGDCCQAKQGSGHLTQERVPWGKRSLGAGGSVPQTCTRELGGSGVSSPAPLPQRLRHMAYLTPPPSSQQRRRREREVSPRDYSAGRQEPLPAPRPLGT